MAQAGEQFVPGKASRSPKEWAAVWVKRFGVYQQRRSGARAPELISTGSTWTTVATLTNSAVSAILSDTNKPTASQRFYRLRLVQ
jgi:hypothetical protein